VDPLRCRSWSDGGTLPATTEPVGEKDGHVSKPDVQRVKKALIDAGVEIYRTQEEEIVVAERVRLHIMDSGVRIRLGDAPRVMFTARAQRRDFPNAEADVLFDKVRVTVGSTAGDRGYEEVAAATVEVKDPVDDSKILDVWHEVTYGKDLPAIDDVVDEVRWALDVEKYVAS